MARYPKVMRPEALGILINLKLQRSGIVPPLTPLKEGQKRGQKRNPIPRSHGFRKFVITAMVRLRINETIRNLLTDHSVKLDKNYYYPTEEEMLQEYPKVVDELTINEEKKLRRQIQELTVKEDKLDALAAQVERLSERMGCMPVEQKTDKLDNITRQLAFDVKVVDEQTDEAHEMIYQCCSCGIRYIDDDSNNFTTHEYATWYVLDKGRHKFQCARCHTAINPTLVGECLYRFDRY